MKKYIFGRIIRCIVAIFAVVSIVIIMLYTMIPKENIFSKDQSLSKLKGDARISFMYGKWNELGYLDYLTQYDMCVAESDDATACNVAGSSEGDRVAQVYRDKGYNVEVYSTGLYYAYHDFNVFEQLSHFYGKLFDVDHPNKVSDPDNPNLERKYYVGKDENGVFAIMCSGCESKYQLYFDTSFPFIHQNFISLDFGTSYPTKVGIDTLDVIGQGQGSQVQFEQTFPTGLTTKSAIIQHSCKYKVTSTLDHMDQQKFNDNYASCDMKYESPSMVSTSFMFGIIALILAYLVAIPCGIYMARKKGKFFDKLGIGYINLLSALPSLALIFFLRIIGNNFGLPDKFPFYGYGDVRSYIMPLISLTLLNTPSLMMWMRRYMIDQSNSDYVKFAKAKGLSEGEIFNRHILKNAIVPIVNGIPISIVSCVSGAVITETVFAIPGMGKMLPDSINLLNNNMVITLTFIFTALGVFAILAGDLLMTVVDPRIKLADKGE